MGTCIRAFEMATPIGTLRGALHEGALCGMAFDDWARMERRLQERFGQLAVVWDDGGEAALALKRYFDGHLGAIDALSVDLGGTAFERGVWAALRRIPPGGSTAYGRLAREVGAPRAARAVGTANGRNPVAIVVPCHRVVRESGALSGYAGGVERKRWLLEHEARHAPASSPVRAGA
jgi:methylated-DNA-[protein]-cysteine S-methyltransferase